MSGGVYGAGLVIALKSLREVLGSMLRLRPYLRGGRRLYALVIGTALLAATLEASALALLGGVVFMIINPAQADLPRSVAWLQDRLGSGERTTLLLALAACALGTM
ncbi:MAG: hypothetical protein AB7O66_17885, partial [Limisphaerales bacterium]